MQPGTNRRNGLRWKLRTSLRYGLSVLRRSLRTTLRTTLRRFRTNDLSLRMSRLLLLARPASPEVSNQSQYGLKERGRKRYTRNCPLRLPLFVVERQGRNQRRKTCKRLQTEVKALRKKPVAQKKVEPPDWSGYVV
jgi:hypothetical protein